MRSCSNCRHFKTGFEPFVEYCIDFELDQDPDACPHYEEAEHRTSSTARDYSPSNPWDAPGMSIRDFI